MDYGPRRQRFVAEYCVDQNGAAAAVRAGYSPVSARVTASRLLAKANVRNAVAATQAQMAAKVEMTRERVVRELVGAAEMAQMKGDPTGMVSAWREVAKMLGFYTPVTQRVALSASGEALRAKIEAMTDGELLSMVSDVPF